MIWKNDQDIRYLNSNLSGLFMHGQKKRAIQLRVNNWIFFQIARNSQSFVDLIIFIFFHKNCCSKISTFLGY